MTRLWVLVEGQTEELFVNELLAPHLYRRGFHQVEPMLLGNARHRATGGGIRKWSTARKDIGEYLKQDKGRAVTTMVDYYALPEAAGRAGSWPGRAEARALPVTERARHVEQGMLAEVARDLRTDPTGLRRFVPFVVMHEFEALLFSDPGRFAAAVDQASLGPALREIRDEFRTPEEIDDSPETHPSKRISRIMPAYQKPFHGPLAALEIGLPAIRQQCPHFGQWLVRLEALT